MTMNQRLVNVLVFVILGQMQPNTDCHAGGCDPERPSDRLAVEQNGHGAADEGRRCEVRARPRGSQIAKREDEQYQAQSVPEKSKHERGPQLSRRSTAAWNVSANPTFVAPAASPFTAAIMRASPAEIFRVRLLSRAQNRQAAAIAASAITL